jgi:hypothetical protein
MVHVRSVEQLGDGSVDETGWWRHGRGERVGKGLAAAGRAVVVKV